jgi:RHS repeat-associated protein
MSLFSWWRKGAKGKFQPRKDRRRKAKHSRSSSPGCEQLEPRILLTATSERAVSAMYGALLQRSADPGGLAFFSGLIDRGAQVGDVALDIEGSLEYRMRQVNDWYGAILGRPADPSGMTNGVTMLAAGAPVEQVQAFLIGSPEYYQNRAGANDLAFLASLYHDMLGRPIDPSGQAAFGQVLELGVPRAAVAATVLNSPEGRQHLIQNFYQEFLHRPADGSGLNTWVGYLLGGGRDEVVIACILESPEYGTILANSQQLPPSPPPPPPPPAPPAPPSPQPLPQNFPPPTVMLTSPSPGLLTNHNVTVTGHVTDGGAGVASVQAQVDAAAFFNVAFDSSGNFHFDTTLPLDGFAEGSHTVVAKATDRAGNVSLPVNVSFMLDTRPPTVVLSSPTAGLVTNQNVTIAGQVTDALSGVASLQGQIDSGPLFAISFDGTGHFSTPTTLALDGSADGRHTVHVRGTDRAGNVSGFVDVSFILTTHPPTIVLDSPPDGFVTNHNVTVSGRVFDLISPVTSLQAQVDAGSFFDVAFDSSGNFHFDTTLPLDHSADGGHTVRLKASDQASNVSPTTMVSFTLDTQPPTVAIQSPAAGFVTNQNVTVAGQVTDDRSGVASLQGQVDAGSFFNVTLDASGRFSFPTNLPLDGSADGRHTVHLRGTDKAGNVSGFFDVSFTLDTQPPTVTIARPAPGLTTNCNITVTGTVADTLSGVASLQAQVDSGSLVPVTFDDAGRFSFPTNLPMDDSAAGNHTVHLRATDKAGNVSRFFDVPFTFVGGGFTHGLTDWTVQESGGSATGHGTVITENCDAVLREGNSFNVTLQRTFTIPQQASVLTFRYGSLAFDATAGDHIKDAFEVALVDATGKPLVQTIGMGRDAFFNITEGQPAKLGAGVTQDGQAITVNLSELAPGSSATLIFRLVNNDGAGTSSVHITSVQILPGPKTAPVVVVPEVAAVAAPQAIDFSLLSDVSASFQGQYGRTSFDEATKMLHADLAMHDSGQYLVDTPLLVGINHLSDPSVLVVNTDGATPEGIPYYDFSGLVPQHTIKPGEMTGSRTVTFFNPNRVTFTYDLVVLGQLNHPPVFTSRPNTEAIPSVPYTYNATAFDPDNDPLKFSLLSGPAGMAVDAATGRVTWSPQDSDLGTHAVALRVDDGRGGTAEQHYIVSAIKDLPNQPPVFTSTPVVDANVNTPYTYQATATDPDGDPLTFSVVSGPQGLVIDPRSGLVSWTPTASQLGTDNVTLQVSDGRGGTATQAYRIGVQQEKGNLPPVIVSTPVTQYQLPQLLTGPGGSIFVTGEDPDFHGTQGPNTAGALDIIRDGLAFVRNGNSKPFLWVESNIAPPSGYSPGINAIKAAGFIEGKDFVHVAAAQVPTANFGDYSAIAVASDAGGLLTQAELDALNARANDIAQYVSAGGGLLAFAESGLGVPLTTSHQFGFLPFLASSQAKDQAESGNTVTQFGRQLGLLTSDVNGNFSHNIFLNDSGMQVIARDRSGAILGLAFRGKLTINGVHSGAPYTYPVRAVDADNDPLTYSLPAGPQGMTIDAKTGLITWNGPPTGGGTTGPPPSNGLALTPDGTAAGFSLTDFARGFPNSDVGNGNGGPFGIAFSNGGVVVSDVTGNVRHFPTDTDGQTAASVPVAQNYGLDNALGMAQVGANIYLAQQANNRVVQLNADGTFKQTIVGLTHATGMVTDPVNGHLFVTGFNTSDYRDAIFDVDPIAKTTTLFIGGLADPDGLTINASGTILYAAVRGASGGGHILGFDTSTKAVVFDSGAINGVDGISLGFGSLAGFIFANTNFGQVWRVDLNHPANPVPIASGGTRGDFVTVDPNDGSLLLTQTENVVRLRPPAGGSFSQNFNVTVRVDDGRGGFDTQSYVLNVTNVQPGEIQGTKFNDLNGNGIRDLIDGNPAPVQLLTVPGTGDPYLAGMPDGSRADGPDVAPEQSPVLVPGLTLTAGGSLLFTAIAGLVNGSGPRGSSFVSHSAGAQNGISNVTAPLHSLIGVFLGPDRPDLSPAPPALDFQSPGGNVAGGFNYLTLSPQLKQVFFIGDGRTSTGQLQQVVVPAGATRLYLATMNTTRWSANSGSYSVDIRPFTPTPPVNPVKLLTIATNFNNPIAIDYYEPHNTLIATVNYGGGEPRNFEEIKSDGTHVPFSNVAGFTDEVYIATVRSGNLGGFKPGDLFVGNGRDGQVVRITDGGQTVINPWVVFPGTGHGLLRGALQFDRTGVFGGDLMVATDQGEFWRINASGVATKLARVNQFIEGVTVVPNDPARYGPLAGTVLGGAEANGGIWAVDAAGKATFYNLGFSGAEALHVIPPNENFFGVDFDSSKVYGVPAAQFSSMVGDILVLQEFVGGLYRVFWDGKAIQAQLIHLASDSPLARSWEGSAFVPAGVSPIPPVPVEPGLPNWTIYLDLNHSGHRDPGDPFTTTDKDGRYAFTNLAPGTYTVAEEGQPGWRQTAPPGSGTYTITVKPGQVVSGVDFGNTQLNVSPGNRTPTFTSKAPTTATVGQLYRYNTTVSNPDGTALTFDLPAHPVGMGVDVTTGVVVWEPTIDQLGSQTVVLRVQDRRGEVALQSFQVTVSPASSAPAITSTPPLQAVVNVHYQYQVRAQDAAGNPITFHLDMGPSGVAIDMTTGRLTYTPTAAQIGTQHIHLTADNGHGGQAIQVFDLTVVATAPNEPPVITSKPRTTTRLGRTYLYEVQASDADGDPLTFSLDVAPTGMTVDAAGVIRWDPTAAQFGNNAVKVRVDDGRGASVVQDFTVNVISQDVNHPPVITSTPRLAATVGRQYQYDLTATDPDGDPVMWGLVKAPLGMSIDPLLGTVRWLPTVDQLGKQDVVIQAQDPLLASTTQSFTITVRSVNVPPVITSVPPTQATSGVVYTYAVQATDVENDPLTFSLTTAPAGMTIDAASGVIHWIPRTTQVGTQDVFLTVDDGQGGIATQAYRIVVADKAGNQAPVITTSPGMSATVGGLYKYAVAANDPDGDKVTFALLSAPAGMAIDTATGLVQWTPTAAQVGTNLVTIAAADPAGAQGLQRFAILVQVNQAPTITSQPIKVITAGLAYRYDVQAGDPDGDTLTYTLAAGPTGMTIDKLGRVSWMTDIPDIGTYHVVLTASDDGGLSATQSYDLQVVPDTEAPKVSLVADHERVNVGSDVTFAVTATDNVRVERITLMVGGMPVALAANGTATVHMTTPGLVTAAATATDPAKNTGTATLAVRVVDPTDTHGPTVQITSPATDTTITSLTKIVGTVTDPHLDFYRVDYAPFDEVDLNDLAQSTAHFVTIFQGTAPVVKDTLATFDPTMLMNDAYVIRVFAQNVNGNVTAQGIVLNVSGELKLGEFTQTFTDLSIPVAGIPIQVTRIYDTRQAPQSGDFGFGWRLGIQDAHIHKTVPPSPGGIFGLFSASTFKVGTKVYLTNPAGKREGFTFDPIPQSVLIFGTFWHPHFKPDPGVFDQLSVDDTALSKVGDSFRGFLFGFAYNPDEFTLTTKEGVSYRYNDISGLEKITDPNGNTLTFSAAGITSSTGPKLVFKRDAQGRIAEINDPAGKALKYTYDAHGDLASSANQMGSTTTYAYLSNPAHYLTTVTDPMGHQALHAQYDTHGRLVAIVDAQGHPIQDSFDSYHLTETVTDPLGHPTMLVYDERGNVLATTDPLGNMTSTTYDANNNPITTTDARHFTTTRTYDDRGNVTSVKDPLGNTTTYVYNEFNKVTKTTDALGRTITYIYDRKSNLIQTVDAAGTSSFAAYSGTGNIIRFTDNDGFTTSYIYASGSLPTQITRPDSTTVKLEYNQFGQPTRQVDGNNQTTTVLYDEVGNPLILRNADGTETHFVYDSNGNEVSVTDPLNNTTRFAYDEMNRLVRQTDPLGNVSTFAYDAAGNRIEAVDRNGRKRTFQYDADSRVKEEKWWNGATLVRTITFAYDAAGNLVSQTDPDSTYTFTYDALNRVTTVDNNGTPGAPRLILTYTYDPVGNTLSVTDNRGVRVDSNYDSRNLLVTRLWQGSGIDPARVDFTYDALGRRTGITRFADPTGTQRIGRSVANYDATGNLTHLAHYNAIDAIMASYDYTFDMDSRLIGEMNQGQSVVYTYDRVDQLTSANHSGLPDESYNYDANGNRISSSQHGTRYVIGPNNQILSDGTFNYAYDAEGNLVTKTEIATGNITTYTYDYRDRLTSVTTRSAGGIILNDVRFGYDVLNHRITKVVNGVITHMVYNQDNVWADFDESGAVVARYLTGAKSDELLARYRPGQGTAWYLTDRLGTVRDIANTLGVVINHINYDSFGNVIAQTNPSVADRFLFTGREFDAETGLYYYRARYYDANLGRFISQDLLGFGTADVNLYRYVSNSPLNATDPTGQQGWLEKVNNYLAFQLIRASLFLYQHRYIACIAALFCLPLRVFIFSIDPSIWYGTPIREICRAASYFCFRGGV